jgi:hypothetical protein
MIIVYHNDIGLVVEEVDEFGISFSGGKVYFNNKIIDISSIMEIQRW